MTLYGLIGTCETDADSDRDGKSRCRLATAATLIVLGGGWLAKTPAARTHVLAIVQTAVDEIPSTGEELRDARIGSGRDELKFAAHAVMHRWLAGAAESETDVLRLLTSGDARTGATVIGLAYANRERQGFAWWRLLRAGVLWSGLNLMKPPHGVSEGANRVWSRWLARLRRFPLRGKDASVDNLDFKRIAAGCGRIGLDGEMRAYASGERTWRGKPERRPGVSLSGHVLAFVFGWLIDGPGTGDWSLDTRIALSIWDYDASRAKARGKTDRHGEYDLPTQNLGYDVLLKLGALSLAASKGEDKAVWEPVLAHGPAAHYALQHFIRGLFLRVGSGDDPAAFERVWRGVVEYGLAAHWSHRGCGSTASGYFATCSASGTRTLFRASHREPRSGCEMRTSAGPERIWAVTKSA